MNCDNKVTSEKSSKTGRVILFPIDGSSHSERAFRWYLDHMKHDDDSIKFITVIESIYTAPAFEMALELPLLPDVSKIMKQHIKIGKELCQQCMQKAKLANLCSQAFLYVDSKSGSTIVRSIADHKADVVIMANRGLGAVRRTFLGSVSDYVLHHSLKPTVIVPPCQNESN
ncbi:hypothetical protein P879_03068 [Paragonimus westermani]|uniref:UspA domain-containing protein n=1 Tax=Paragonimus westermani TaxID=34504 RepID=A0A8T0DW00_9TREM|nr:hypothetical protein P879_03068 [Paragonimus westermani]